MIAADTELAPVLSALGLTDAQRLGGGSEASVYALDAERVARIHRPGTAPQSIAFRNALLNELSQSAERVPFALPTVLDQKEVAGRTVTIERCLPGEPLSTVLETLEGAARTKLIERYLEAVALIGELEVARPWLGDLREADAVRTSTFRAYLTERAARSLALAGTDFATISPQALAAALPEPNQKALVHFDAFAGNVLCDGETITAILDFGATALIGDRRLDPLTAVIYLTPEITPSATEQDRLTAQRWLEAQGWANLFEPMQRWVAAYWAFASDDLELHAWCRRVLLPTQ